MSYHHPDYPKLLTKALWDKKKGIVAKVHGKTGVGEAMSACEKAYHGVKWDKIELGAHPMSVGKFTKPGWEKRLVEAKSEVTGNLRKLVKDLYSLRDTAKKAADKFKKSRTIPKSSTKLALEIAKTADQMGVSLNANSVGPVVMKEYQQLLDHVDLYANSFTKLLKKVLARTPGEIAKMRKSYTGANFNNISMKAARDITQNLTNIVKFNKEKGYDFPGVDMGKAKKLSDLFIAWANSSHYFKPDVKEEVVKKEVDKFEKGYKMLKAMFH
jgi:hypothetical protein